MVGAMITTKLLWRKCFFICFSSLLLVFSSGQYSFARCWLIWMQFCALCPFGLTCQQLARSGTLGTLWD